MAMQGAQFKAVRKSMQLTQSDVAEGLGLSRKTVNEMEGGSSQIERRTELAMMYLLEHPEVRPASSELPEGYSLDQLMNVLETDISRPWQGRRWGPWLLDAEDRILIYEPHDYEIDLDGCTNACEVIDWLGQIAGKNWGAPACGYLVLALDEILSFQANLVRGKPYDGEPVRKYLDHLFGSLGDN